MLNCRIRTPSRDHDLRHSHSCTGTATIENFSHPLPEDPDWTPNSGSFAGHFAPGHAPSRPPFPWSSLDIVTPCWLRHNQCYVNIQTI